MTEPSDVAGPNIGGYLLSARQAEAILGEPVDSLGTVQTFDACSYMGQSAELSYAVMELPSAEEARAQYEAIAKSYGPRSRSLEYGDASISSTTDGVTGTFTLRGAWNISVIVRDYGSNLDTSAAAIASLRIMLDALPDLR